MRDRASRELELKEQKIAQEMFEGDLAHCLQDFFQCDMSKAHQAVRRLKTEGFLDA